MVADPEETTTTRRERLLAYTGTEEFPARECSLECPGGFLFEDAWVTCPLAGAGCRYPGRGQAEEDKALADLGIGKRYRGATREQVSPAYRDKLDAYLERLEENLENGIGLLVSGKPGTGKSCLLAVLVRELLRREKSVAYYFSPRLFDMIHRGEIPEAATSADFLVLDDLFAHWDTGWNASRFAIIVEERHVAQKPCLVSTNVPPKELQGNPLYERVADRWKETLILAGSDEPSRRQPPTKDRN
jgi:hypothetical protein